jgi:hypothetical protein
MDESTVSEKAVSKAQQKFMGMVYATKKGAKAPSKEVAKVAKGMSKKSAKDFAKTKHKGLPQHVKSDESVETESKFSKLSSKLAKNPKIKNPDALAAKLGRKKYGKAEFQKMAAAGKKEESFNSFRHNVKFVNESLTYLLKEDEEGKAKAITAAGDIVNDFTSWMQRVGQYQTKAMIELADSIRANFGVQEAETFKQAVAPALTSSLETLTQQREAISNAVAVLAGEAAPEVPMGAEPGLDASAPDALNPEVGGDEFAASDAAAGAGTPGREMRESREERRARRLAEQHSIITKLAK